MSPQPSPLSALDPVAPVEEPLTLPQPWAPPGRAPLPLVAAVVPLIAAVALWLVTGSVLSLWLGLLGPLIAVATRLDAGRAARRDRRRSGREWEAACDRVEAALADRHDAERQRRWSRTPDVAGFLARDAEIWRFVPGRSQSLVVGAGDAPSGVQVGGGADEPRAVGLRRAAATL